ncbi:arrestin domain-containing protein 17-like [Frankliniella occidentalis]|uniref:Arrestin domain-containing protein 17-like n=1 Tax=Frankliniella occidentalis TaxID=133901 RepID=A0A6J1T7G7_FRAOC|nr:arrestin domain-containing protein 17-like [Frankliniella occidentalis]XP_052132487.1 arrestin domain-containing protein 17-like [Frankliniella occidentalis]
MPTTIEISFDEPLATYFPGETVSGRVHVHVDKPKRIRAVSIKFSGDASVWWSEDRTSCRTGENSRRDEDWIYKAKEKYFRHTLYFVGGESGMVTLDAGDHTYPFQYLLPQTLPNSFEGKHGYVRYTAKATISRWWSVKTRVAFTVKSVVDLSMIPQAEEPVERVQSKDFTRHWGESPGGPLTMGVRIPRGGYFPGQTIPLLIKVDNASSIDVLNVRGALIQVVTWHADEDNNTLESVERVVDLVFDCPVPANKCKAFCQEITVPPVLPSHLDNCSIIDLEYFLAVTARVSGAHFNLEIKAPILIGTAPEAEKSLEEKTFAEKSLSEKSLPDKSLRSLPDKSLPDKSLPGPGDVAHPRGSLGLPSPDLLPPSYEESVLGQHQR